MATEAEPARSRGWGRRILKPAVALFLLLLVAGNVPWRDRLVWEEDGERVELSGTIRGDWRAEQVRFEFDDVADAKTRGWGPVGEFTRDAQGVSWRPGMLRLFGSVDLAGLVPAVLLLMLGYLTIFGRWWRLLVLAGCPTSFLVTTRLSSLGLFFNLALPGVTGGDLVKAYLATREHPARRADAVVSIVMDRLMGILGLVCLAAVAILFAGSRFAEMRMTVSLAVVASVVGLWLLLDPRPRRRLGLDGLIARLPQGERLGKLDQAFHIYGRHPFELALAFALSVVNHLCSVFAVLSLGRAFGDALPWTDYLTIVPIANATSAIPIAPGGWGVGEAAYGTLFALMGATAAVGVAVSISYRLLITALGLAGGAWLLLPGGGGVRREVDALEHTG